MKIAIVGSGVSGLVAAHLLRPDHDVTVVEADSRVGGHANTVDVTVDGRDHAVDTGFIVYNEPNYPGFCALLRELDVATQPTDMSFGVTDRSSGLEFRTSNLNTIFAQRRNLVNPSFVRLLADIIRFNRAARELAETATQGRDETHTKNEHPVFLIWRLPLVCIGQGKHGTLADRPRLSLRLAYQGGQKRSSSAGGAQEHCKAGVYRS